MNRFIKGLLVSPKTRTFVDKIERTVPLVRSWHRFEYEQHFLRVARWERLFSGVYPTFAAAMAAIPANRKNSYDNPDSATFLGYKDGVRSSDYPVVYWLSQILPQSPRVFDFGGYLGISYYSFDRFLHYPPNLEWTVYDVDAVVQAGERLALEKDPRRHLSFTQSLSRAQEFPIFLSFGSFQFTERTIAETFSDFSVLPKHMLLNKLPLTDQKTFYTLQNTGPALCPYRVENEEELLHWATGMNYEVVDQWENLEFGCYIPFHPEHSVRAFSGMYLRQK